MVGRDDAFLAELIDTFLSDAPRLLVDMHQAVEHGDADGVLCPPVGARNMTLTVNAAHESSGVVHRIDDAHVSIADADGDPRYVVAGLDDLMHAAAQQGVLLSDLTDAPSWAHSSQPFDCRDYRRFPQQFTTA